MNFWLREAFYSFAPKDYAAWGRQLKIGGESMARTPTKDIMTDDIVYKNRSEQPPDSGKA